MGRGAETLGVGVGVAVACGADGGGGCGELYWSGWAGLAGWGWFWLGGGDY